MVNRVLVAAGLVLGISTVHAQTVGYRIGSGPVQTLTVSQTPPYTNLTIDLPSPVSGEVNIQVFDVSGTDDSLGIITVRGTSSTSAPLIRLAVLQAIPPQNFVELAFPDDPVFVAPGLKHLGGIQFTGPVGNPSDVSLRDRAWVSVNIRGDLTGDVTAGLIWRAVALRSISTPRFGGTISGNLRATRGDGAIRGVDGRVEPAIRFVNAAHQLTGDLIADGERDSNGNPLFQPDLFSLNTWGSIRRVVVGGSDQNDPSPGIRGDILAEYGVIDEVFTTGQIGTGAAAQDQSKIYAGVRIGRVTIGEVGSQTVLDKPIYADINAARRQVASPLPQRFSTFSLIETEGDFYGSIKLHDVFGLNDQEGPVRASNRKGIFIGGDMHGPIDIAYSYQYSDIVARSFRQPITIGQMLKGAVVAVGTEGSTDPLDGTMHSISVGYSTTLQNAPRPNLPGFNAIVAANAPPPFEGPSRDNWYTLNENDLRTVDSVIRATSIGDVRLKAMSQRLPEIAGKFAKARLEAQSIGRLQIDNFDSGVVWSGLLNSTTSTVTNLIEDDYAMISETYIGCMGPKADLWVRDIVSVDVLGDAFGEIHMPTTEGDELVRIGGRLGELNQALTQVALCYADSPPTQPGGPGSMIPYASVLAQEESPRGVWVSVENAPADPQLPSSGIPEYGRVLIRKPTQLVGQIILDASNPNAAQRDGTHFIGDVLIGTGLPNNWNQPGTPFVISTKISRASSGGFGPNYASLSATLGGGAVGLVPFSRHASDCLPLGGQAPCGFSFPQRTWPTAGGFNGGTRETFVLRHYGPVFDWKDAGVFGRDFDRAAVRPLKIERQANVVFCPLPPPNPCPPPVWEDVTNQFHVYVPGQSTSATLAASREVWVAPVDSPYRINRNYNYRFTVAVDPVYGPLLRCDRTFTPTNPPAVIGYPYEFFPICIIEGASELMTWDDLPAFSSQPTDFTGDGVEDFADVVRAVERLSGEEE